MRKILFRGKSTISGEWVFGMPICVEENTYPTDRVLLVRSVNYDELDHFSPQYESEEVIPATVGQFTGLHDKRGKGVFEGDIVQYQDIFNMHAVVCFGEYQLDGGNYVGWYVKVDSYARPVWAQRAGIHSPDGYFINNLSERVSTGTVIGSIYDSPDPMEAYDD